MKKNKQKFYSKEIKKNKELNEDYKRVVTFIIVLLVIGAFVAGLFILNGKYITKDLFQDETTTTTTEVTYDASLLTVSTLFTVKDSEYLVMLYDSTNKTNGFLYNDLVLGYVEDKVSLYSIDMSNQMNKKYYDTKGKENKNPTKSSEILITRPTLMHIKKGKVVSYITNRDEIISTLEKFSKKED